MPATKIAKIAKPVAKKRAVRMSVSETNLRKAAARLLTQTLVSTEVQYIQRTLGATATQEELDANVLAVRKLPWSSIVAAD